jgi:hypothetical protein
LRGAAPIDDAAASFCGNDERGARGVPAYEWSDVRYFLAAARDGSALAASKKLR